MLKMLSVGGMAEWLKAAVLKTAFAHANVGSNPTPSAKRHWDADTRRLTGSKDWVTANFVPISWRIGMISAQENYS